jgi:large subunit ribosomal protein L30
MAKKPEEAAEAKAKKTPGKYEAKRAAARARKPERTIAVTQIGSPLGRRFDQRQQLIGLGLNKLHRTRVLEDTPAIRGMIFKVRHLVKVEESA